MDDFRTLLGPALEDALATATEDDAVVAGCIADAESARVDEYMAKVVEREGFARDFELQLVRPDGTLLTVLDTVYGVLDPESNEVVYHGMLVDITQRKRMEEDLRQQSMRDPLTGCFNRRYLAEMDEELSPSDSPWGCLFIDIDHFKHYNDTHGHQMGDNTLIRMSRFLMRQVRAEEPVIRVGGDEFVIVLRGASEAQTMMVAQRVVD